MSARLPIHLRCALSLLPLVAFPRTFFRPRLGLFVVLRRPRTRLHRHTNTKRTTTPALRQSHLAVPSSDTVPQISWHPPLSASFLGAQIDSKHHAWYSLSVPAVSIVHWSRNKVGGHHTVVVGRQVMGSLPPNVASNPTPPPRPRVLLAVPALSRKPSPSQGSPGLGILIAGHRFLSRGFEILNAGCRGWSLFFGRWGARISGRRGETGKRWCCQLTFGGIVPQPYRRPCCVSSGGGGMALRVSVRQPV